MAYTKKAVKEEEKERDVRAELIQLLKVKSPSTFEREPAAAYTPELEKLADAIIELLK